MSAFHNTPQHRAQIMDELVGSVLPNARAGRVVPRAAAATPEAAPAIHIVTSLVLQLLQVGCR